MKIAILGLGRVALSLIHYFQSEGHQIIGLDDQKELSDLSPEISSLKIDFYLGGLEPNWKEIDQFYKSPGISLAHPLVQAAHKHGLEINNELDLAFTQAKAPVIAITGTNGKSTTTTLIGEILKSSGKKVAVGRNLGVPFLDFVRDGNDYDCYVLELSSFQTELIKNFKALISVLLNVTDDHFEHHGTFDKYLMAKAKLFHQQVKDDFLVYNADDIHVLRAVEVSKARKVPFSSVQHVHGIYEEAGKIKSIMPRESEFDLSAVQLKGLHNLENMMAAVSVALLLGVPDESIQSTLNSFQGLEHRMQRIRDFAGVTFYDDSKATNVGAVVMSLASFDSNVILIAGGKDKGGDYSPLKPLVKNKCKSLVLLGEAKEILYKVFSDLVPCHLVSSMDEAVKKSFELAEGEGQVLLSPACSSFDMYKNYVQRGQEFQRAVHNLE